VTLNPRASKTAPKEAAAMPFPKDETTPPVTKIKRVIATLYRSELFKKKVSLEGKLALKTYDNSRGPIRLKMGGYFATNTDSNPLSSTQNQLANESFDRFHQN
jgi:hypothetical protein